MKKIRDLLFFLAIFLQIGTISAQDSIKNVILMIPDGCSTGLISTSRLYAQYLKPQQQQLTLDNYFCGFVLTHSSDAPIGDSAPTTSCYVTGLPSQSGFISTYPVKTDHDLYPIDGTMAYQPLATLLEAARILQNKATGLVFTCEFPHATPADCSAHNYNRKNYVSLARQMIHNQIDVVMGGGKQYLDESMVNELKNNDYQVLVNDKVNTLNCQSGKLWAVFNKSNMDYEIDRIADKEPSLAEMTEKAIQILSQKPEGFFLMVEGSNIDKAAHANDIKSCILEFLAFDDAVKVAIDFAQKDRHTLVLILPDHGCGGFNVGNRNSNHGYDKLSLRQIMQPLENIQISTAKLADTIKKSEISRIPQLLEQYCHIQLTEAEMDLIYHAKDLKSSPIPKEERNGKTIQKIVTDMLYADGYIATTSYGHTGEDVFMACYHPYGKEPKGAISNVNINKYLCQEMGIGNQLTSLTNNIFAKHQDLFADAQSITIDSLGNEQYRLTVTYKKHTLVADSEANYVTIDKQRVDLESVVVYMKKNNSFYLPKRLKDIIGQ